ncbi:right-handed parallel beta-helix repeat-containing protein [Candidatus Dependentiae bacterium]|nr:right-handed parallel beta-helix repeat-containing protein [Candidatus Dependentiae bacterium]
MHFLKHSILPILLIVTLSMSAGSVAIIYDTPGQFLYSGGMQTTSVDPNDSMIIIATSNIVLDLGGNIFFAGQDSAPGFTGITIAPNVYNVTIKNGIVAGFTGNGIRINDGCYDIFIDNITTTLCADAGINSLGSLSGIMDVVIKNCTISDCMPGLASVAAGIHANNTTRMRISNCYFEGNQLILCPSSAGVHLENSSVFELLENRTVGQRAASFAAGYMLENCTEGIVKNCLAYATTTTGDGTDSVYGFYMSASERIWINNCQSVAGKSETGKCIGFFTTGGSRNIFEKVLAQSDQGKLETAGISLASESSSYINDSIIRGIVSTNESAYGIKLDATCSLCHIEENLVSNNSGSSAFGIVDLSAQSSSLIVKNECFNSGTHYLVSYPGFSIPVINGSLSNPAPGLPAQVCGTFDNVSVTI